MSRKSLGNHQGQPKISEEKPGEKKQEINQNVRKTKVKTDQHRQKLSRVMEEVQPGTPESPRFRLGTSQHKSGQEKVHKHNLFWLSACGSGPKFVRMKL